MSTGVPEPAARAMPGFRLPPGVQQWLRPLWADPWGRAGVGILAVMLVIAILAPYLVPFDPFTSHQRPDGGLARLDGPSMRHWLGTTYYGHDVLTQTLLGTRRVFVIGLSTAFLIALIGTNVGLVAGYAGGWIDDILMRITDLVYAIPFLPFMIVLVSLVGTKLEVVVIAMALIFWRTAARVVRSQVLTLRTRPYVLAARASGAGHLRILYVHLLPNVLPLGMLYLVFGVAWAVLTEASLAFLGLSDQQQVSWGMMLNQAFRTGSIRNAWWWVVPPGFALMLFLVACYFLGRAYEELANPRLRGRT
jgi:peptide/nickel transport system permease protein